MNYLIIAVEEEIKSLGMVLDDEKFVSNKRKFEIIDLTISDDCASTHSMVTRKKSKSK